MRNSIANFMWSLCVFLCVCEPFFVCQRIQFKNQHCTHYSHFRVSRSRSSLMLSLVSWGSCLSTLCIAYTHRVFIFCALNNNTRSCWLLPTFRRAHSFSLCLLSSLARPTAAVKLCIKETPNPPASHETSLSARPYYMKKAVQFFQLLLLSLFCLLFFLLSDSLCLLTGRIHIMQINVCLWFRFYCCRRYLYAYTYILHFKGDPKIKVNIPAEI